jgi:Bacterial Ig-like domain (group 2)
MALHRAANESRSTFRNLQCLRILIALLILPLLPFGCGSLPVAPIALTVSPSSGSLVSGVSQQFSATLRGSSHTAVTWWASKGTIASNGLFTAPVVSSNTNVTITATSVADPTVQARAVMTISAAPTIRISVSPTAVTLAPGQSHQFTAWVRGTSNTGVTWHASSGTISSTGLFTAPVISNNGNVTVSAISSADNSVSAKASVGIAAQFGASTLAVTPSSLSSGTVGRSYSGALAGTGGTPPLSWSVLSGQLPPGITLASNGTLSGRPTTAGTYSFNVHVVDSTPHNQTASAALNLHVNSASSGCTAAPSISNVAYRLASNSKSITISWDTDIPSDTQVLWGDNDHLGGPNSGPLDTVGGKTTGHSYSITGLYPLFLYGMSIRDRCVDSNGPTLNTKFWARSDFNITPPLPVGPFQWAPVQTGPHYTFAGYSLYYILAPRELQIPAAGINWNYTVTLSLPAGWSFAIESCGASCFGFPVTGTSFTRTSYNSVAESYLIHLTIPQSTTPGAYNITAHTVDNTFGSPPQDATWVVNILNPVTDTVVQAAPPTSFPPIPCQHATSTMPDGNACRQTFDGMLNLAFVSGISHIATGQMCTDNTALPNGYGSSYEAFSWYYDGIRGYQNVQKYTGNANFATCLADAIAYLRDRFYVYEGSLATGSTWATGHTTFARGLYADYLATATPADLAAINIIVHRPTYAGKDMELVTQNVQREVAYRLEAETVWTQLGNTDRTDLLNRAVAMTIGSLDESCVSQNNGDGPLPSSVEPAFIGLAADSLIYYYNNGHQGDIRIPWAIKKCADWLWKKAWITQPTYASGPDHTWDYLTDTRAKLGSDNTDGRVLNGLIYPIYGWLFRYTGNAAIPDSDGSQCYGTPGKPCTYQQAGDAAFVSSVTSSGDVKTWGWMYMGKEYSQNTRWAFDYINWRTGR